MFLTLANGVRIPQMGLGVFRTSPGEETRRVVRDALSCGYRHIDTASVYKNEADVAQAVRDVGLPREEVFLTTKIWNQDQGFDETLRAFDQALSRMKLEFVDLLLLHWPVVGKRLSSWRAFERIQAEGRARSIGVSNFMPHHLEELLAHCQVPPAVDQVELSPFLQQSELRKLCAHNNIVVEAYSPLTKGFKLNHPTVTRIAGESRATPAQVLLAWGLLKGLVVLPKSIQPSRMAENLAALDLQLSDAQLSILDGLEEGLVTGWDPRNAP